MKIKVLLTTFVSAFYMLHSAWGQGALTPPGAPAPTMKTLAQIEARTPISTAPFTITASGSYYLTANLTINSGNAITVSANNVTLDLNGFTLFSTETTAANSLGILLNSVTNITILHGFISGGVTNNGGTFSGNGFSFGIYDFGGASANTRVSGVSVSGCLNSGIYLPFNNAAVESCTATTVGGYGIIAQSISDSTAQNCGVTAIYSYGSANNCAGACIGSGDGIDANLANNCSGTSANSGIGILANIATGCYGESDAGNGYGIYAYTVSNCTDYNNGGGDGIYGISIATGCYGYSISGIVINTYNAAFCTGSCPEGTAIEAYIANGCVAGSGMNSIHFTYNMP